MAIIVDQVGFEELVCLISGTDPMSFDATDKALGIVQRQLDENEGPGKYEAMTIEGELLINKITD